MEFKYFQTLFLEDPKIKITKKNQIAIEKEAIAWLKLFGGRYGTKSRSGTPPGLYYYYTPPNILIFETPLDGLSGGYHYRHIIKMYHFAKWQTPSFIEGNNTTIETKRSDCPYPEADFYNHDAWNLGFTLKIYKYSPEEFLKAFETK
jgi:hypothetical protein